MSEDLRAIGATVRQGQRAGRATEGHQRGARSSRLAAMIVLPVLVVAVAAAVWRMRMPETASPAQPAVGETVASADPRHAPPMRETRGRASPLPSDPEAILPQERRDADRIVRSGRERLYERYMGEHADAGWASAKEQMLRDLAAAPQIDALGARPVAVDIQCRSSVCRIDADFPDPRAAQDWFTLYTLTAGKELPNVAIATTHRPDGSVRAEIYGLGRE